MRSGEKRQSARRWRAEMAESAHDWGHGSLALARLLSCRVLALLKDK